MKGRAVSAELLSGLIRGEAPAEPGFADADFRNGIREAAEYHGVLLLIAHRLRQRRRGSGHIEALAEICAERQRADAATGLIKEKELGTTIDGLAKRGVFPLLMKGTPLAYSHYPSPDTRARADTDMLIPSNGRNSANTALRELGYRVPDPGTHRSIHDQLSAEKRDCFGVVHTLDVHWKLSNHKAFADLFSYEELARASVPLPELGANARALGPVHALLLACMHRVAHIHSPLYIDGIPRCDGDRLIWLYDIHLLLTQMSPDQIERFAALAIVKRIGAVCLDGTKRAARHFGTRVPAALIEAVSTTDLEEPSAGYLVPGRLRHLLTELRFLAGRRARIRFLNQLAFPDPDYVLKTYEVSSRLWLPLLYLHRGLRGLCRLVRQTGSESPSQADRAIPAERFE